MPVPRRPSSVSPDRRRRVVQYLLAFVALVVVVDGLVGNKGLFAMLRARDEYRDLQNKLEKAKQDNAELRTMAYRYRHDPAAIEALARERLGMIRNGERVYVLKDADPVDPTPAR